MQKVKWFLGEFFVVVAGVLVAFLLNGWWMSIQDTKKEQSYLKHIHRDLMATIGHVEEARDQQKQTVHAASTLLSEAYSQGVKDDKEISKLIIRSMSFAPSAQISATLASLVSTGDLQLISSDSLRMSLTEMLSTLDAYEHTNDQMAFTWLVPAYERFADASKLADLRFQIFDGPMLEKLGQDSLSGFPRQEVVALPHRVDVQSMMRQADFRNELLKLQVAHTNLYRLHSGFMDDLEKTRTLLEAEMDNRGIAY